MKKEKKWGCNVMCHSIWKTKMHSQERERETTFAIIYNSSTSEIFVCFFSFKFIIMVVGLSEYI